MQFKAGRRAQHIAKIQKISRRMVYKLVRKYEQEGADAFKTRKSGRPRRRINPQFVNKVVEIRKKHDYGSEKIHYILKQDGYSVSQRQIQHILDDKGLTDPCPKRRGQRTYVRFQWPISNYMWHTDWSFYNGMWYIAFIDDRSRRIMASAKFKNATEKNVLNVLYQAILTNGVCPVVILSDKGTQFFNSNKNKKGERPPSLFEQELRKLGIDFWTSRRNHPQTNGKMEKWFDTLKKRMKKHPEESLQGIAKWYNEERIHHALNYNTPEQSYWENL